MAASRRVKVVLTFDVPEDQVPTAPDNPYQQLVVAARANPAVQAAFVDGVVYMADNACPQCGRRG